MKIFTSRTVWTVVVFIVFNVLQTLEPIVAPHWQALIDSILGILAIYFRANPQAKL